MKTFKRSYCNINGKIYRYSKNIFCNDSNNEEDIIKKEEKGHFKYIGKGTIEQIKGLNVFDNKEYLFFIIIK